MTPEHAFLDSIWEDLDDDTTKLIFSDWLEDQDDWRTSLLRWQVERNQHGFWTRTFQELHGKITAHLYAQGREWLSPLGRCHAQYSDGTGLLWLTLQPNRFPTFPEPRTSEGVHRWVTEITLGGPDFLAQLAALNRGPQVRLFLNFSRVVSPDLIPRLLQARGLERVRSLDLTHGNHSTLELRNLLRAPQLHSLQYLFLGCGYNKQSCIPYLAEASHLRNLRGLDLARSGLIDENLIALSDSPVVRGLSALYLEGNHFTHVGIENLIAAPHLGNLRVLNLTHCKLDPDAPYMEPLRQRFPFVTV